MKIFLNLWKLNYYYMLTICIVFPGLLEVGTQRGGGREEQHYRIGIELSRSYNVIIISPFYRKFRKRYSVNDNLTIEEVYFPACNKYPPIAVIGRRLAPLSLIFYSLLTSIKIVTLVKRGLKVLVVTDPLTGSFPAVLAKLFKVKVIFSEGNLWPWINPYIFHVNLSLSQKIMYSIKILFSILICHISDFIRVQSPLIKMGMIKHGIDSSKIIIIEGGIDVDKFNPTKIESRKDLKIGFIGRLTNEKGAPLLLEACRRAEKEIPGAKFIICGDGPYKESFRELKNIEHIGWVDRNTLPRLLSNVNIILFFQKDLGIAELEALAQGKVIITTNLGEIPKIIQQNVNGIICPPDPEAYIKSIKLISSDIKLLKKISENARETAIKHFSWDAIGDKWRKFIWRCIGYS